MPTIFERIDTGLAGNDVSARLNAQMGKLDDIGSTIESLIRQPPQGIEDLLDSLRTLPLPDIPAGGQLAAAIADLRDALPSDPTSVTGDLTASLEQIGGTVADDLVRAVTDALAPILQLAKLLQIDLRCEGSEAAAGGEEGGNGTQPGGGGAGGGEAPPAPGAGEPAPPGTTASVLSRASAALDLFPSPVTIDAVLAWLAGLISIPSRDRVAPLAIPILDDLRDSLATLIAWKGRTPAELSADLAGTLSSLVDFTAGTVDRALGTLPSDLAALAPRLQTDVLATAADGLVARLAELASAVSAGDLSGIGPTVSAMQGLLDQIDGARESLEAEVLGRLPGLASRLEELPGALEVRLGQLISVLQPNGPLPILFPGQGPLDPVDPSIAEAIDELFSPTVGWLQDLVATLDLSAVQAQFQSVAASVDGAVDDMDRSLAEAATAVEGLFTQASSIAAGLDVEAAAGEVSSAIQGFASQLTSQLTRLFAPLKEVVAEAVAAIDQAVDGFDPADVVDGLRDVIGTLSGVLEAPEVTGSLHQIQGALDTATAQLQGISFTPVTDQVVAAIGQITSALQAIDTSLLSAALQAALSAAVALLPEDLTPVTDPLVAEFDALVDAGPSALVAGARAPLGRLLEQVKRSEPATMVGGALSAPFQQVVGQLEGFTPSALLEPVNEELAGLKERLRAGANPGTALRELEGPFDQLLRAFDSLNPEQLVKPLEEALQDVIDGVLSAIPLEQLLEPLESVLARVRSLSDAIGAWIGFWQKAQALLASLADGPAQLDAWVDSVLSPVAALEAGALQTTADSLTAAVLSTKAASVAAAVEAAIQPALAPLDALDPSGRLASVVQAARAVPAAALAALPDSTERSAAAAVLGRLDPMGPAFPVPFQALAAFAENAHRALAALTETLGDWDARYHAAEDSLALLADLQLTGPDLAAWLREAVDASVLGPVRALLAMAAPIGSFVEPLIVQAQALASDVAGKLTGVLAGPGSLGAIKDAVEGVVQRLRDLDLGSLKEGLAEVFDGVRSKLRAIDPAKLREVVERAFDAMLDELDVSHVLPVSDLQTLDADFAAVIVKLRALDPGALVVDVVQPEFEQKVLPLVNAFDVSALLDEVVEMLRSLKAELQAELERVDEAYKAMLAAVPAFDPLSLLGDVSLDVSLGVGSPF